MISFKNLAFTLLIISLAYASSEENQDIIKVPEYEDPKIEYLKDSNFH